MGNYENDISYSKIFNSAKPNPKVVIRFAIEFLGISGKTLRKLTKK